MINITKLKTIPEQVYENTENIKNIETDVEGIKTQIETVANNANDAYEEAEVAKTIATNALSHSNRAYIMATDVKNAVNQAWEKDFIDVTITPEMFVNLEVELTNEIFKLNNIITLSAAPDNGTNIDNNGKNIAYYELRPIEQTEDGKITLKVSEMPAVNLYIRIEVEIQINVEVSQNDN